MKKIIIYAVVIVLYVFLINFVPLLLESSWKIRSKQDINYEMSMSEQIGISDDVSVTVVRERFYGKIYQYDEDSYVYLLYFVKLPLKIDGKDYLWFHVLFTVIVLVSLFLLKKER